MMSRVTIITHINMGTIHPYCASGAEIIAIPKIIHFSSKIEGIGIIYQCVCGDIFC